MKIDVLTLFPEMFSALNHSILERAQREGLVNINLHNIRDFSLDNNKRCDDYSFGGGAGMIMTPQPLFDAISSVKTKNSYVVYLSPKGKTLTQSKVESLASSNKDLVLVCGHYEGIDERIIDLCVDEEISIGDYVLTGGELPAMILIDAISRYIPNVLGNSETTTEETFTGDLLEYPQFTRPNTFKDKQVPSILASGNHKEISNWRLNESIKLTKERRPDLYKHYLKNNNLVEVNGEIIKIEKLNYKLLIDNLNKLSITSLATKRIKKNLQLDNRDVLRFCKNRLCDKNCQVIEKGKNLYCRTNKFEFTINKNTLNIITAHRI